MRRMLVAALVFASVVRVQAGAAMETTTVDEVMAEIRTLVTEKKELEAGFKQALSIKAEIEAEGRQLDGEREGLEADGARFDRDCVGRTVPEAQYASVAAACEQRESELNVKITSYNERLELSQDRAARLIHAVELMAHRAELIDARLRLLQGQLLTLRRFRDARCDEQATPEAMWQCLAEVFDGAPGLGGETIPVKPPFKVTPQ